MRTIIRKATAADATAVWQIRSAAIRLQCRGFYPEDLLERWTDGQMTDRFVKVVADKFYVATVLDDVVGTGMICLETGQVDAIFVRPDMMRHGVGRSMLVFLERLGSDAGLTELVLSSTLNAAAFYRQCGFVGDTIGVYQSPRGFTLDCIPMSKALHRSTDSI